MPDIGITKFAMAMDNKYKVGSAVESYRNYFNGEKRHLANWGNRGIPSWFIVAS